MYGQGFSFLMMHDHGHVQYSFLMMWFNVQHVIQRGMEVVIDLLRAIQRQSAWKVVSNVCIISFI